MWAWLGHLDCRPARALPAGTGPGGTRWGCRAQCLVLSDAGSIAPAWVGAMRASMRQLTDDGRSRSDPRPELASSSSGRMEGVGRVNLREQTLAAAVGELVPPLRRCDNWQRRRRPPIGSLEVARLLLALEQRQRFDLRRLADALPRGNQKRIVGLAGSAAWPGRADQ